MIDYEHEDLFKSGTANARINISYGNDGVITNSNVYIGTMEISESLCSERELRFGSCEASVFKIRLGNILESLIGKTLNVSETLDGNINEPFLFGNYKVYSDKPTADRKYRDIVAYDAMYDILNADVADWYNVILPTSESTVTLKQLRDSFAEHFGIEQEDIALINDGMTVTRSIEPSKLSGKDVLTAICEINGCFGHIGRDGKLCYIHLKEMIAGLYPSTTLYPSETLFPARPQNATRVLKSQYSVCTYEDFKTQKISKLLIRQDENDVGTEVGGGDNRYIVEDNFLLYGKGAAEMVTIAENMLSVIKNVYYRPAQIEAVGNPCLEVGDGIRLSTTHEIVYTYILQRTLKGIQALKDTYTANGVERYAERVNGVRNSIKQLKGKTNRLEMTIEETRLEIADIESGLSARITANARAIELATQALTETGESLSAQITLNAQQIQQRVSKGSVISEINQSAEAVTISANKIDLVGLVNASQFAAKYATIETLNVLQNLIADKASLGYVNALNAVVANMEVTKLSAESFNAETISAMNITAKTISGAINASQVRAGAFTMTGGTINVTTGSSEDNIIQLSGGGRACRLRPSGLESYFASITNSFYFQGSLCRWGYINGVRCIVEAES